MAFFLSNQNENYKIIYNNIHNVDDENENSQ